jgi:3-deoxy-7-phosphoheptulonate synthase
MIESFLVDGCQRHAEGEPREKLVRGQSITDACMGWERTVPVLEELAEAVVARRGVAV